MAYWFAGYVIGALVVGAILSAIDSTGNPDTADTVGTERLVLRGIAGVLWPLMLVVWAMLGLVWLVTGLAVGYSRTIERIGQAFRR